MFAARYRHTGVVEQLLQHSGIEVNETCCASDIPFDGPTPLIMAARSGYVDTVRAFLNASRIKLNINKHDCDYQTALICAAIYGHDEVVEELVRYPGIDLNVLSDSEGTALMAACARGYYKIVQTLLRAGADLSKTRYDGVNALMWASEHGYSSIVQLLFEHGADVTLRNNEGKTALDFVRPGSELAHLLMAHGAYRD